MQHRLRRAWAGLLAVFAGAAATCVPSMVAAQEYPARPVSLVVPTTTGGTADMLARLIGPKLAVKWGQPVIVENRTGAGTLIGSDYVARAKPDGYTLMLTFNELVTLPAINPNARLDVLEDFTPIARVGTLPVLVLANPSMPADDMDALLATLREEPGKYTYSSNGTGGVLQLYTEMFKQVADVDVMHVPYRGALEASLAALSGEVDLLVQFANGNVEGYVNTGKLKAYAVASPERLPGIPDVPTSAEAGLPDLQLEAWYGLFAPAGTPDDIVAQVNRDVNEVLQMPDIVERMQMLRMQVQLASPEEFTSFYRNEHQRWTQLIESAGIAVEQ